ncbi:hypothetical protein SBM3_00014 [Synechococcus phage S-BM3]|nr:hypothetical protein SBM3_00014 [Synechococcus phage S-BM3]
MNDQWIQGTEVEYKGMRGQIAFVDSLYITIAIYPTMVRIIAYPCDQSKVKIVSK